MNKYSITLFLVGLGAVGLTLPGCGGGGAGILTPQGVLTPAASSTPSAVTNSLIVGNYGSVVLDQASSLRVGFQAVAFDGNGNVTSQAGTNLATSGAGGSISLTAGAGGDGSDNVSPTRFVALSEATGDGNTSASVSGLVTTTGNFLAANLLDSSGDVEYQLMVRLATNPSNAFLTGIFRFNGNSFVASDLGAPSTGTIVFDGNGNITGGSETFVAVPPEVGTFVAAFTGGTYTVNVDGSIVGSITESAGGGTFTQPFNGFMGADGTVLLAIQNAENEADIGFKVASQAPSLPSSDQNFAGTVGAEFVTGGAQFASSASLQLDGGGNVTGGVLLFPNNTQSVVINGEYSVQSNGEFGNFFFTAQGDNQFVINNATFNKDQTFVYGNDNLENGTFGFSAFIP